MRRTEITIDFYDIKNLISWDYDFSDNPVRRSLPDGKTTLFYLERFFTASKLKKYRSKSHFAKCELSKQALPTIEELLNKTLKTYQDTKNLLEKTVKKLPFKDILKKESKQHVEHIKIEILPCAPALSFVRINQLCDESISLLKQIHLSGSITTKEYYQQRNNIYKDLNKLKTSIKKIVDGIGEKVKTIKESEKQN
ncbi:hypothetical protein WMR86_20145 (plasmid) [Proteus vulgaris]|uniref:hypothetical protein n=1 Tax=Morganellaceae TaxID=1903414 RepID=UPI00155EE440|nr:MULTISPECIES: hypothetical protein [Morganellaceae]MBS3881200.1 hypothetical protein [Proteus mirabilis]MCT0093864.1 hypothetical protein [Proteus mirabilis]QKG51205.1 hypothetical protein HRD56_20490 [Proteus mirabilis]QNN35485.1 hypothetical protein H9X60_22230 [Providencia rettgeri]